MTWLDLPADHPFGLHNLPYGVFSVGDGDRRVGVRIGDHVLDVAEVARIGRDARGVGDGPDLTAAWEQPTLNAFLTLGRDAWSTARAWLTEVLSDDVHEARTRPHLVPVADVTMHLPFAVADYVDFYASEHHATNVGRIFRPDSEPLTPNWKHLPIGYHGRSGTVVVSGTDVVRPTRPAQAADRGRPRPSAPASASTSRPSSASSSAAPPPSATPRRPRRRRRARLRRRPAQRLVRPRHPGLGVRPARAVPRQVLRDARSARGSSRWTPCAPPGCRCPARTPSRSPYLRGSGEGPGTAYGLDIHVEVDWNGHRRLPAAVPARCTGRRPRCSPT